VAIDPAEPADKALSRLLRAVLDPAVVCAWCHRISIAGEWRDPVDDPVLARSLDDSELVSHGICPTCFGRYATGVAYPA
jgi:hypothetical protein